MQQTTGATAGKRPAGRCAGDGPSTKETSLARGTLEDPFVSCKERFLEGVAIEQEKRGMSVK